MRPKKIAKENGFAQIPHGIIDAAIPDTLKLLLWYCYDKSAGWTFSVPEVHRSLGKTPQCIRKYFRVLIAAGAFTNKRYGKSEHFSYPYYTFDRTQVDAVVKSQLKVNPETDPESDVETDVETNPETDPDIQVSDTKNDIPRLNTKIDGNKKDGNEIKNTKGLAGTPSEKHSEPSHDAEGGGVLGGMSTSSRSAPAATQYAEGSSSAGETELESPSQPPSSTAAVASSVNSAEGSSDAGGNIKKDATLILNAAPIIQRSADGNANTTATNGSTGRSANSASGTSANLGGPRGDLPPEVREFALETVKDCTEEFGFTEEQSQRFTTQLLNALASCRWDGPLDKKVMGKAAVERTCLELLIFRNTLKKEKHSTPPSK